ncbi:MAG: hypothetical protein GY755_09595 [Chloroflexi bacterium]|nr:hypothetical protein [Chloroflexota bacterium]
MASKNKFVARKEREEKQAALIRNIAIGVVIAVLLLIGYGYLDQTVIQKQKAVASVNEEKITISEFQARVRLDRENLINQYLQYAQFSQYGMDFEAQLQQIEANLAQPLQVGQNVLDTMINELIYKAEADKRGITVSEEDVEKELQAFLNYFPDGTPVPAPSATPVVFETSTLSPEQLELVTVTPTATEAPTSTPAPATATPEAEAEVSTEEAIPTVVPPPTLTATPYTLEGYQQAYEETLPFYEEFGMTEESFRSLFEARLFYTKLYEEITADTPHESEYIWARHILVEDGTVAALIRERLLAGEDFAVVAAEASTDPSAAFNAGDLGWFTEGMMVAPFSDAAFALELGEISEVVQSDFGFHVIQLLGRENRPLDADAYQRSRDIAFQKWLEGTRAEYTIDTFDNLWLELVPSDPDLAETLAEIYGAQPGAPAAPAHDQ